MNGILAAVVDDSGAIKIVGQGLSAPVCSKHVEFLSGAVHFSDFGLDLARS